MKKEKIKSLLLDTQREGMPELLDYLEQRGFFDSPASTRFHGNYEQGLIDHSLNVLDLFREEISALGLSGNIPDESIVICSLLHDVCKAGMYIRTEKGFMFNPRFSTKGHSTLSLARIKNYIDLTEQEENIIMFHMGFYGAKEFNKRSGEYHLKDLAQYRNKDDLIRLFHWCDDKASSFLDKKV